MSKFTPFDLEICVDDYVFDITITYLYVQKPMGRYCDSDVDCYGYTDLEWECKHVYVEYEDGSDEEWFNAEAQDIADEYAELLEEKVMVELEEMKNDCEY